MNLPNPVPGVDSGPDYADNLESSLNQIDQHNHSAGQGVLIQPNGINISSDLPFGGNNATALRSVRLESQSAPITNTAPDVGILYVSGNELWYNDYTGGNQVQITVNGLINATSSGISSGTATAAFSAGVLVVKSSSTSFANIDVQSVVLANAGNLVNQLTLLAPTLSSSYDLTLPLVPPSLSFLTVDSSGVMGYTLNSTIANAVLAVSSDGNLGGNAVKENGKNLVVSNTNATSSLAIIRGTIEGGSPTTVFAGEGFSVVRNSSLNYSITFSTNFGDTPVVVVGQSGGSNVSASAQGISSSGFLLTSAGAEPTFLSFIAVGQRA